MRDEIKKLGIEFHQKLVNSYIDNAYFYYEHNVEEVKNNLRSLYTDNPIFIPTFSLVIDGKEVSKEDAIDIIKQFINDCIVDYDKYIYQVLSSLSEKRFSIIDNDPVLSVKNKYGDILYYNQERLDYLRNRYGKIKDHEIRSLVKKEKRIADNKRCIFQRLGSNVAPDYSFASHIEYKYYVSLFKREFNIEETYLLYSSYKYNKISKIEYIESKIDEQILENDISRSRK